MKIALINLITATPNPPSKSLFPIRSLFFIKQPETDEDVMIIELGRALTRQGHKVTVYVSDAFKPKYRVSIRGLFIKYLRTYLKWLFPPTIIPFTPGLLRELRKGDFDIIQTAEFLQWGTILSVVSIIGRNTPIVVWQGLDEIESPIWMLIHKIYSKTLGKLIQRKVSLFITKSTNAINFLRKNGVPCNKIYGVVPVGVNTSVFQPVKSLHFKEKLGIERDAPLILTVARLHPHKGLEYLIKAMEYVVREEPKAFLIIKGDGPLKNKLETLIHESKLEKHVQLLTSSLPRKELVLLYASCDFAVLPSLIEIFGFVVLESLACGKPVIASNVGGPRDILNQGKGGILVEPRNPKELAEKIIFLIRNPAVRMKMEAEALEIVKERYEWNKVAELIISAYKYAKNLSIRTNLR